MALHSTPRMIPTMAKWGFCEECRADGDQFCWLDNWFIRMSHWDVIGQTQYSFKEKGDLGQRRGILDRNAVHESPDEVATHCQRICEKKGMIVLPAMDYPDWVPPNDLDKSIPAVKEHSWDLNYARGTYIVDKWAHVFSHIDIYMDTDDMCKGCR